MNECRLLIADWRSIDSNDNKRQTENDTDKQTVKHAVTWKKCNCVL